MEGNKRKAVVRVLVDIVAIACVGVPVLILFAAAKGYERGFFCDDESLMHPYKSNTIPTWVAGFVGIVLPSLSILIIEGVRARAANKRLFSYMATCYKLLVPFYFGAAVTQLTTDIAKYSIGFITGDVCTGDDTAAIAEARLSFPSGHSSMSFYCMIWLMLYLQFKFTWRRYWLIRPVLQAIAFYLAYYTALSRISDYMHHWSDVLCGSIIGIAIALLDIFFMSDLLPWKQNKCQECSSVLPLYNRNGTKETDINTVEHGNED